ncbi:MAG: alkanesulfonate monooxygenase, partial [Caballeronia sp.]|nr:alkanesulfonate monooxygenase [Caballeronia sp.]
EDYVLRPAGRFRERPRIYVGCEAAPARSLVAERVEFGLINGQPLLDVRRLIEDVRGRVRTGPPLRFGLSAFVIARPTDGQAQEHLGHLFALAAKDAPLRALQKENSDPKVVMHQTFAKSARVGSNGGTAAGLVGSYETVARRIVEFHRAGIELFMLQFQPFEADMKRFAQEVIPLVRELTSQDDK